MGPSSRLVQNDLFSFILESSGSEVLLKPCPPIVGPLYEGPYLPILVLSAALAFGNWD